MVDEFFIQVHRHYFHDCSMSGRRLRDPPNRILGPFIAVPILITLLMTALVVWRSKRSEGIVKIALHSIHQTTAGEGLL
ncbi:Receptor activity-modifying protein 1 [Goodea atripinnis]|uniref:Receptor activity-modifying protein 1 n=1 Tax=Goodea atripinnis TaxID=208336 RepID=A0ABV0MRS8_9TELE